MENEPQPGELSDFMEAYQRPPHVGDLAQKVGCIVQILAHHPEKLPGVQQYGNARPCYNDDCKILGREMIRVGYCIGVDENARLADDCPINEVPVTEHQSQRLRVIDTDI